MGMGFKQSAQGTHRAFPVEGKTPFNNLKFFKLACISQDYAGLLV